MSPAPSPERLEALLETITETPAPTFEEGPRADVVARLLQAAGADVERDAVGNVVARLSRERPRPLVLVAAHLDTVFPAGTDVRIRRDGDRLYAPGIGDNSASLAVLAHWVELVLAQGRPEPAVVVAATVGEEGLGDLRGARELVSHVEGAAFVALDGHLGTIVGRAVGSKRFEVSIRAAGGHSWGDYPSPSAVHAAGDAIHALTRMPVPAEPKSTYNVGRIQGGRSINAIAEEAWFDLDLRSLDPEELERLAREARKRIRRVERAHGVSIDMAPVGERPAAHVDNDRLIRAAREALASVDVSPRVASSSTDANAAMAAGIPSIGFGVYRGGDAHRTSEWLDPSSLPVGFRAFASLMEALLALELGGAEPDAASTGDLQAS